MARIYGKVESPEDISRINCIIRDEMLTVEDEAHLSELKKRSDYLCTLSYSPFWQKKFANNIEELREVAIKENRVSVKTANIIAKYGLRGQTLNIHLIYAIIQKIKHTRSKKCQENQE